MTLGFDDVIISRNYVSPKKVTIRMKVTNRSRWIKHLPLNKMILVKCVRSNCTTVRPLQY